jgi:hypothetical protein
VTAQGWGWDRPGALPAEGSARQYLNTLADEAEEWFRKRPDDALGLARRLQEFRHGCTTLIFAEHQPLAERDRGWLVERCRAWAAKLDKHLEELEAGADVAKVREAADQTVRQLAAALRTRAESV